MKPLLACMLVVAACGHGAPDAPASDGRAVAVDGARDAGAPPEPALPALIPGPGAPGFDAALADKARAYDRQFHVFNAAPFGLSLDAYIPADGDRQLVTAFLAQTASDDFAAFSAAAGTPRSVHDVVSSYDEHGDLGMFAGAGAAADAFRYIVLRDSGADASAARTDLLAAIAAFHVAATITGTPGTVARGIERVDEPGALPATTAPPASCPMAGARSDQWRPDGSGTHPDFIYRDDNSKDQIIGYAFALGAFWDAIDGDPAVPQAVRDQVQADARALADSLMTPVPLGFSGTADLIVRDWHDCPTKHMDLNPRVVPIDGYDPLILGGDSTTQNGWNALAALGVMRTLYHVAGDADIGHYYYDDLIGTRDFLTLMVSGPVHVGAMYQDNGSLQTNFSNVNMAFVAIYGVLRYETDPGVRARVEAVLEHELWDLPHPHDAHSTQQALFNLIDSAFRTGGNDAATTAAAVHQLGQFAAPPYFDEPVVNCDAGELAAGSCIAIDGTTPIQLTAPNSTTSRAPLPKNLRPTSNFEWRSDPRTVNGGGSARLNPGGDFRVAYWMGRLLHAAPAGSANVSPHARPRP